VDDVSEFLGMNLYIKRNDLPALDEDEFYWTDIHGMKVFSSEDEFLGKVTDFIETGSNDVFVVSKGSDEILVPATREVIKKIDYEKNHIIVELLEGLR